ncbi:MAG: SDR family NAD(P)-dependent oxidoreductase, partial [Candidatus Methylomirabilis sp.]|nr:SDR family NAD(P)-dependent oxidoreductase [Deltaproteobacteria bacterium]
MFAFKDKVALVTGAASGIGRASALALAREGMDVVLADLNEAGAREVAAEIEGLGRKAAPFRLDVSDAAAYEAFAKEALAWRDGVDLLMNNAGYMSGGKIEELALEDWRRVTGVNFLGVVHGVHFLLPSMLARGSGYIVNVASMLGLTAMPWIAPYVATKHAVVGFTESLRAEVHGRGVGVTLLCPGAVDTRFMPEARFTAGSKAVQKFLDRGGMNPEKVAA